MKVIIVGKTRMQNKVCIGALELDSLKSLRLLNQNFENQEPDAPFQIGQVWDIEYQPRPHCIPPHLEDVAVTNKTVIETRDPFSFLSNTIRPIQGSVENLFDGYLQFAEAGSAFIAKATGVPQYSTSFWQPDQPLCMSIMRGKIRFRYESASLAVTIPYVGFAPHMPHVIPAGSLIRVSLARWWRPADSQEMQEERCYLQLSGWFPKDSTSIWYVSQTSIIVPRE